MLKISNVPFPISNNHAAEFNASFNEKIVEFSLCFRILIESYNDGYMPLVSVNDPHIESPYPSDRLLFREDTAFFTGFEIDGLMFGSMFVKRYVPGGGIGNRAMPFWHHIVLPRFIEPGSWFHFCSSYSSLEHKVHKYQDGYKVFSHRYSDQVEDPLPATTFQNVEIGYNVRGLYTDFNIYSSFLAEEDMIKWTTSCDVADGDIFSWDASKMRKIDTDGKNVSFVKMDRSEVCPDPNKKVLKQRLTKSSNGKEKKRFQPKVKQHKTYVGLVIEFIESTIFKDIEMAKDMRLRHNAENFVLKKCLTTELKILPFAQFLSYKNFIIWKIHQKLTRNPMQPSDFVYI